MSNAALHLEDDPLWRHARREAFFVLGLWLCCFLWTVSYCYLHGYLSHDEPAKRVPPGLPGVVKAVRTVPTIGQVVGPHLTQFKREPESLTTPLGLGIPDWVFYGVVLPWLVCIATSVWWSLAFFVEDDLRAGEDGDLGEEGAHG